MTISELIAELESIRAEHGDWRVHTLEAWPTDPKHIDPESAPGCVMLSIQGL